MGASWRDPEGKEEFVNELFWGVPQYLWYEVGRKLTKEDIDKIVDFFWGGQGCSFGDLEMHRTLRVRNAKKFTALLLGEFPLRQIGHIQDMSAVPRSDDPGAQTGGGNPITDSGQVRRVKIWPDYPCVDTIIRQF